MIYGEIEIHDRAPRSVADRGAYLESCAVSRDVLHVGCTDWPMTKERIAAGQLLHARLEKVARSVIGIDIADEGLLVMAGAGHKVEKADAENLGPQFLGKFDVVLAGDVL